VVGRCLRDMYGMCVCVRERAGSAKQNLRNLQAPTRTSSILCVEVGVLHSTTP